MQLLSQLSSHARFRLQPAAYRQVSQHGHVRGQMWGGVGRIASDRLRGHSWTEGGVLALRRLANDLFRFTVGDLGCVVFMRLVDEPSSVLLCAGLLQ